jgi:hypothetical protein
VPHVTVLEGEPIDVGALASMSGDESMPSTWACGQRCASEAVSSPVPQPRSTTVAGLSARICATRSKNGRERSSA